MIKAINLKKREKFVVASVLASLALLLQQLVVPPGLRERQWHITESVAVIGLIWSLWGSWEGLKILPVMILPSFFTLSMIFISALPPIPTNFILMLLVTLVYGFSFYSLLLIANIYSVSAIRTIPLIRAAHTVGFLFTLVTNLLLFHALFSFHFSAFVNYAAAVVIAFPLSMQSLWAITLDDHVSLGLLTRAGLCAYIIAQVVLILSFWPSNSAMKALFITLMMYVVLGILHHEIQDRIQKHYIAEYLSFGLVALTILTLTTSWRGS